LLLRLFHILDRLSDANPYPLVLGAGVLAVTLGTASVSSKIPGAFFGLLGAGIAVVVLHLQSRGVDVLGALSIEPPHLTFPPLPSVLEVGKLITLALVVAMVCIMQTSAVASTFPSEKGMPDDASRDFAGTFHSPVVTEQRR
jgi:SulP family sulfate permease